MARTIVPQDRATIVAAAKEYTASEYAEIIGASSAAVRFVARRHRVKFKPPRVILADDVRACHEQGLTPTETARKLGVSGNTVRKHWPDPLVKHERNSEINTAAKEIKALVNKDPNDPDNWRSYAGENVSVKRGRTVATYHPESRVSTTGNSSVMAAEG